MLRLTNTQWITVLFLAMAVVTILGAGKSRWLASTAMAGKNNAQNTQTPEPITAESLTLTPTGFYPREFTHPKGRFILAVNNRTGQPELNLTLSRDTGNGWEKQKDAQVLRNQPDWNDIIDLVPGNYVITEASNPKWECRFTITPR